MEVLQIFRGALSKKWQLKLLPILSWLWTLYFALTFTIGRIPDYTLIVIWGGLVIPVVLTMVLYLRHKPRLPREAYLIAGILLWSLPWIFFIESPLFWAFARALAQYVVLVVLVTTVIRYGGRLEILFWAMLVIGVYNALSIEYTTQNITGDLLTQGRAKGVSELSSNTLAALTQMGVFGALGLLGMPQSEGRFRLGPKVALLIGGMAISLFGLVASGGRGAFLAVLSYLVLWPTMCLRERIKNWWALLAVSLVIVIGLLTVIPWLLENTFLGQRFVKVGYAEDNSANFRLELIQIGLQLGLDNPIFGVGLGQFGSASGTGFYAHNEFVELFATTGFVGVTLYVLVYYTCWRRLSLVLRLNQEISARYWSNVARMGLLAMFMSGLTNRPNFLSEDSMFLMSFFIGIGLFFSKQNIRSATKTIPLTFRRRCPQ